MAVRTPNVEPDLELCREAATMCACFNFRKASRTVTQMFDEALAPVGLRSTQLVILIATHLHGELTSAALADVMVTDRSTLSRNLQPLVKRRLLRMSTRNGQRSKLISLTPTGKSLLNKALPRWQAAQASFVSQLGDDTWQRLLVGLSSTVEAVRQAK